MAKHRLNRKPKTRLQLCKAAQLTELGNGSQDSKYTGAVNLQGHQETLEASRAALSNLSAATTA